MPHFTELVDLASERLGGSVVYANDDFFAPKENLLKVEPAVWDADRYTDRGKWMDGWESRRRRTPGHDFCVVKLGLPGIVRGVDVDTAHFKGNFPEACSLEAASTPIDRSGWQEILPRTSLKGDSHNLFPIFDRRRFTHVRLRIYPDGGVARLRVHGDVSADWARLALDSENPDLCALAHGGLVVAVSDSFFGSYQNLLMPGSPTGMHDGWETKRSRRSGYDWAIVRLGTRGAVQRAEVDTSHFKGNFPDRVSLETCDLPGAEREALLDPRLRWEPLLPQTHPAPHTNHVFTNELLHRHAATHVRLCNYPDGGIGRLRLFGQPTPPEALLRLNAAGDQEAVGELLRACGSARWAERLAGRRPFASHLDLLAAAEEVFDELADADWLEAFRAHPRIGDREALKARFAATKSWAEGEQAGALAASDAVLDELMAVNETYETHFGHIFIVCATGLSATQMLASARDRMGNPKDIELSIAAEEQRKITRLRLTKLLAAA